MRVDHGGITGMGPANTIDTMSLSPPSSAATYDLGLVMAGAVSAGAYTAGVIDFMVQALDDWENRRSSGDERVPGHRVRLRALTGASAGAMTAAILAGIAAGRTHRSLSTFDPGRRIDDNALFESWVNRIDIDHLLDTGDVDAGDGRVLSLLNGDVLDDIAQAALPDDAGGQRRPWLADELRLALTVTNLRGVPYNIGFASLLDSNPTRPGHGMRRHADLLRFRLGRSSSSTDAADADLIELDEAMRNPSWQQLRQAALASGAFPLLLPPQRIERASADYLAKRWPMPGSGKVIDERCDCTRHASLSPHWGDNEAPAQFGFYAVDGGMLDNQPFAAARELLVGVPPRPPEALVSGRALIAVDPFPDLVGYRDSEPHPGGLLDFGMSLLAAMRNQTRFKPDELVAAADDALASRLLIAPSRRIAGERMDHPLAGGVIHGFGGFLDRAFRLHDFWLGRGNCQRFFQRHFRLPAAHPLFANWTPAQRRHWDDGSGRLPVVPLFDEGAEPIATPAWPTLPPERVERLRQLLQQRSHALLPQAIDHLLARSNGPMRWLTGRLARWQSRGWVQALVEHILSELRRRGQL